MSLVFHAPNSDPNVESCKFIGIEGDASYCFILIFKKMDPGQMTMMQHQMAAMGCSADPAQMAQMQVMMAAAKITPEGIAGVWTDEAFMGFISKATEDMVRDPDPATRDRCIVAVRAQRDIQTLMNAQIVGDDDRGLLQRGWFDESEDIRDSLEQRMFAVKGKIGAMASAVGLATKNVDKATAAFDKEEEKVFTLEAVVEKLEDQLEELKAAEGDGPGTGDVYQEAEDVKNAAKEASDDAKLQTKELTKNAAATTTEKLNGKKGETGAKTVMTKADGVLKKAAGDLKKGNGEAAELQAAVDEAERIFKEAEEGFNAAKEVTASAEAVEKEAKAALLAHKAVDKEAAEALKVAIKAEGEAKKGLSGSAAAAKKIDVALVQAETKLKTQVAKAGREAANADKFQALLDKQNGSIADLNAKRQVFQDRVDTNNKAIEDASVEIKRLCAEAREPEMAALLVLYQAKRDELLQALRVHWSEMLAKEQQAKQREEEGIKKHGSKEAWLAFDEAEKKRIVEQRIAAKKKEQEEFKASMIAKHGSWDAYLEWKRKDDARIEAHKVEIDAENSRKKKEYEAAEKSKRESDKIKRENERAQTAVKRDTAEAERKRKADKCHASDRRLKTDVQRKGQSTSGLPMYTFRYQNTSDYAFQAEMTSCTYTGVMAQDLLLPQYDRGDAVIVDEATGYYLVDYSALDVECIPIL